MTWLESYLSYTYIIPSLTPHVVYKKNTHMYFMIPFRHPQFSGHNLYLATLPRAKMSGPSKQYRNMFMNLLRSQQSTSMIFKLQGKWQLAMQKNWKKGNIEQKGICWAGRCPFSLLFIIHLPIFNIHLYMIWH